MLIGYMLLVWILLQMSSTDPPNPEEVIANRPPQNTPEQPSDQQNATT